METKDIIALVLGAGIIGVGAYFLLKKPSTTGKITLTSPVIQYSWDEDLPTVNVLVSALGCPAIKITTDDTTLLQPYKEWILVGGQIANPIYAYLMALTSPQLPIIGPSSPLTYSHGTTAGKEIYGIAAWEASGGVTVANDFISDIQQ